jgi:hypothetical protein
MPVVPDNAAVERDRASVSAAAEEPRTIRFIRRALGRPSRLRTCTAQTAIPGIARRRWQSTPRCQQYWVSRNKAEGRVRDHRPGARTTSA